MLTLVKWPQLSHVEWSENPRGRPLVDEGFLRGSNDVVVIPRVPGVVTSIYPNGYTHGEGILVGGSPPPEIRRTVAKIAAHLGPQDRAVGVDSRRVKKWRGAPSEGFPSVDGESEPFLLLGVMDSTGSMIEWDRVVEFADKADVITVPVAYRGPWLDQAQADRVIEPLVSNFEGWMVRSTESFHMNDHRDFMAVRT